MSQLYCGTGRANITPPEHLIPFMFGLGGAALADGSLVYYLTSYLPILAVAVLASTPLGVRLYHKLPQWTAQIAGAVLVLAGLTLCTAYLVDGTYNPFLYFRF